jgi:hypothetical protein
MLSAIFSSLGGAVIDKFFGNALKAFEMYNNKQISMEELKVQLQSVLVNAVKEVEVAHADALARTYASFMGAVEKSLLMQCVWAAVTISQLCVLLWHQIGIPFFVMLMRQTVPGWSYPGSGSTVEWAYLLLGACIGAGPLVLRGGPGAGNLTDRLKSLVK